MRALGTLEEQARERREKLQQQHGVGANLKKLVRVFWWSSLTALLIAGPFAMWYTGKARKMVCNCRGGGDPPFRRIWHDGQKHRSPRA